MALVIGNRAVRAAQIAFAERVGNDQDKMHAAIEAALLQLVGDVPVLPAVRKCRVCGCTDDEACPGGCSWSQPEICSTCAARQHRLDEQYLTTLREQEHAAKLQSSQVLAQLDFIAARRALIDEQTEVAKMQREEITGVTWRQAVLNAGTRNVGSILNGANAQNVRKTIRDEAEWFAHELATPPVVF